MTVRGTAAQAARPPRIRMQGWGLRLRGIGNTGVANGTLVSGVDALRAFSAYVLIAAADGEARREYETEWVKSPTRSLMLSCRDFVCLHATRRRRDESWRRAHAFFLTGFEELRPATAATPRGRDRDDARRAMDRLRAAIDGVAPEQLRLSTTPEAWLGTDDEEHLTRVTPNGTLVVAAWERVAPENERP